MITFWAGALALSLLLYVLLDGFDLGIGMLFPFAPSERVRRHMLSSISPIWDGNETWLVVAGTTLFGAFPLVYAIVVSAFYLPIILMLVALILRGVAFEFRYKAIPGMRRVWDAGFVLGSFVATFVQGTAVGALVAELPVENGRFVGGPLFWFQPLALACGVGLCIGYALMGACWLVAKSEGGTRDFGYRVMPRLGAALLVFLVTAFAVAIARHFQVMDRWVDRPILAIFPIVGIVAGGAMVWAWRNRRDRWLFACASAIFASAFGTLAVSFLPFMVPFTITIEQAASPHSSLTFMFWGAGIIVLPLTLFYTAAVYWIFRGKIDDLGYEEADEVRPTREDGGSGSGDVATPATAAHHRAGERVASTLSFAALVTLSLGAVLRRRSKDHA
ncbi:MAG: cytochrome d ubiquinol oxidase subunit II [Janthinobacterium lividum]